MEQLLGNTEEEPPEDVLRFKNFVYEDCQFLRENHYVLQRFSLDIHFQLNKNPKKNGRPFMMVNLVFGG